MREKISINGEEMLHRILKTETLKSVHKNGVRYIANLFKYMCKKRSKGTAQESLGSVFYTNSCIIARTWPSL